MESNNVEQIEKPTITTTTITGDELHERIYHGKSSPQDPRFLPIEKGGVFRYFNLNDFVGLQGREDKHYSLVEADGITVGLSELQDDPYRDNNLWLKFISVDPAYQGKGYASRLTEEVFRFAKESGVSLQPSTYTKDGDIKLRHKIEELAIKYSVKLTDERA